ncbi:DUF6688 domain-containing protein [Pseudobacteroides cellulosolvens]|uniref:Uncharacterized protein n=1 Tax=Pseudobacteroides cellulosolvens ATCC 35603 = DSM 2933 TaxID=398512 RepID=A0A0L6JWL5_9FIRM|nr:DUF6688 family protein [Pseudobacteroides cellulosolvens]KNY29822.1 hypothetical protein Bccel_5099 [Pseudobacteroides cellulosolvens ATCC 35603 = DSM 2933]
MHVFFSQIFNMIMGTVLIIIIFALPIVLTFTNVINLLRNKPTTLQFVEVLTIVAGTILTLILYGVIGLVDYDKPLYTGAIYPAWHAPIASWHMPTILVLGFIGIIGFLLIRLSNGALPPLTLLLCFASMFIGCILALMWIIQLSPHLFDGVLYRVDTFYLCLFPFNCIILYISAVIKAVGAYIPEEKETVYKNAILQKLNIILRNSKSWPLAIVVLTIPILAVVMIVLVILGQHPDAAIKAFTETSDWLLSQKISPPSVEAPSGHYLCTVSLRGHRRVVKPLRYGLRHNNKIVVNRQLCVANAFEDLLKERVPKGHRVIRYIYDKYGYPLSKHIKTPLSADVVYILMKPLEWIFVAVLYLMDRKPENRIAGQYLPYRLY